MPALESHVAAEVANWIAANQAVKVAQNLLRENPDNGALQTRLLQATNSAEEAKLCLKSALRNGGFTPAQLQEHLRQLSQ
jgi:alkylhydroperoxidase/carboxymuconolactone decarboxylase family protein YurZ